MARSRARDRTIELRLGEGDQGSELLSDPNIVCARIDAKLFGRLRLLSLEARVVAGKPTKAAAATSGPTPLAIQRPERLNRKLSDPESTSDLGRAVELWTLSSEVLEGIRAHQAGLRQSLANLETRQSHARV